jgi:hypothetical protein
MVDVWCSCASMLLPVSESWSVKGLGVEGCGLFLRKTVVYLWNVRKAELMHLCQQTA